MSDHPRFGTDGVRGLANAELTPELALALGRVAVRVTGVDEVVVGRDTRRSGPLLEAALCAGIAAEGARARRLGVLPTPAVASEAAHRGAAGAMLSASHNPFDDNGIKLFGVGGIKLSDEAEARAQAELDGLASGPSGRERRAAPTGEAVGDVVEDSSGVDRYVEHLVSQVPAGALSGLSVVIDAANGAASPVAARVFEAVGARVRVIHAEPDGININAACGSTDPGELQRAVVEAGADLGLALDGDADRLVAVDERGGLIDGDRLLALFATDLRAAGRLADDTVVVTVMTNLGFRRAMEQARIQVHETPVGDRYVLAALDANRWSLGGEQSGHIIFRDRSATGDGLLSGLMLADLARRRGGPLSEVAVGAMERLPQVLVNVRVASRAADLEDRIADLVASAAGELGDRGRILVRPSGTEPLVRVMVEAPSDDEATTRARSLADAIASRLS